MNDETNKTNRKGHRRNNAHHFTEKELEKLPETREIAALSRLADLAKYTVSSSSTVESYNSTPSKRPISLSPTSDNGELYDLTPSKKPRIQNKFT